MTRRIRHKIKRPDQITIAKAIDRADLEAGHKITAKLGTERDIDWKTYILIGHKAEASEGGHHLLTEMT